MVPSSAPVQAEAVPDIITPRPSQSHYHDGFSSTLFHSGMEEVEATCDDEGYHSGESILNIEEAAYYFKPLPRESIWKLVCSACAGLLYVESQLPLKSCIPNEQPRILIATLNALLLVATSTYASADFNSELVRSPLPIPCHSHDDYWRKMPVFSALHVGCIGIEADVWLKNGELFVGHARSALRPNRTFTSLYVEPLLRILKNQNGANGSLPYPPRGVYDMAPAQTVALLIDLKSDAMNTWPVVLEKLGPLREKGWLSYAENGLVTTRPITVVATGNSKFSAVVENRTYMDAFFDAPLDALADSPYNYTNSYYSSVSFKHAIGLVRFGRMSNLQVQRVREQVARAHSIGLKARYWGLPAWPTSVRNHVWGVLRREGVDILNVDDLKGAEEFLGHSSVTTSDT